MIKLITPKHLDKWSACGRYDGGEYDDATLARWLKGRKGWTPLEVADLRQVPAEDRLWVLLRKDVLGAKLHREASYAFADRVVRKYALPHSVTREWAKRWLSPGRTTWQEAARAADAAWNAAASSAAWAAFSAKASTEATWAAEAADAADAAAWADAWNTAAWANAWNAATRSAAWAAGPSERRWQLAWLRKRLKKGVSDE
jgi:hypothetical protein